MSSSATPPTLPDAYLDVYVQGLSVGAPPTRPLVKVVSMAPVTVYVAHSSSRAVDIRVSVPFFVGRNVLVNVPGLWQAPAAYQFMVNPDHPTYALFDGFEWVGSLEDAKCVGNLMLDGWDFTLDRTFVVNKSVVAAPPPPTSSGSTLTMDALTKAMQQAIGAVTKDPR